jgi:hypothetical protein
VSGATLGGEVVCSAADVTDLRTKMLYGAKQQRLSFEVQRVGEAKVTYYVEVADVTAVSICSAFALPRDAPPEAAASRGAVAARVVIVEFTSALGIVFAKHSRSPQHTFSAAEVAMSTVAHIAHVQFQFRDDADTDRWLAGFNAMGEVGAAETLMVAALHPMEDLRSSGSLQRQSVSVTAANLGTLLRKNDPSLRRVIEALIARYRSTHPERGDAVTGPWTMAPGSGRAFWFECAACRVECRCAPCSLQHYMRVWIADDGTVVDEKGANHGICAAMRANPIIPPIEPMTQRCDASAAQFGTLG